MIRVAVLFAQLIGCLAVAPARFAHAGEAPRQFVIGNRTEPDDTQLAARRAFCADMRTHHGDKNANALRAYIDPRYLKKHDLTERNLSVPMVPVWNIHSIHPADDGQTVYCLVDHKATPGVKEPVREVILLRITVYEGRAYLAPPKAPDAKTGTFAPWILRTKL